MTISPSEISEYGLYGRDPDGMGYKEISVGSTVTDDLTGEYCQILSISYDVEGNVHIVLDSDYLQGLRHPWEIS